MTQIAGTTPTRAAFPIKLRVMTPTTPLCHPFRVILKREIYFANHANLLFIEVDRDKAICLVLSYRSLVLKIQGPSYPWFFLQRLWAEEECVGP